MSLIRKKKLTKQQTRQIQKNQQDLDDSTLATGLIISHFGKQLDVQLTALPDDLATDTASVGDIWRCHARPNLPMLTTGDTVKLSLDTDHGTGIIKQILPRTTLITRPDRYHKLKPVASNVDILVIVFAPLPKPATELIDRYLLIARLSGVTPLLVLNKADILDECPNALEILQTYQKLGDKYGFATLLTSQDGQGLEALRSLIGGRLSVFAGQSGVGKSSLINRLLPDALQATNVISTNSKLGQHTTTTSRLLPYDKDDLSQGGIIDTPGIREYGVWHLDSDDILQGFDELAELSGLCRYRDCNHAPNAKDCAFWQGVADGKVSKERLESFLKLLAEAQS